MTGQEHDTLEILRLLLGGFLAMGFLGGLGFTVVAFFYGGRWLFRRLK